MPGVAKLAAWTSLFIWIGILSLGRWIAYYEPPERRPGGSQNPTAVIEHVERGTAIATARTYGAQGN
jgi:hypothetical protein